MNALAQVLRNRPRAITVPAARAAVEDMTYELIPLRAVEEQIDSLPAACRVSVTASPVKTLEDTLDLCARLLDAGHRPVPHLAARMVDDVDHVRRISSRMASLGLREAFCIAGDHADHGDFPDAMAFVRALLDVAAGDIERVGVASYPDGHPLIDAGALSEAIHQKQELLTAAGVDGHLSSQMCFSPDTIRRWLTRIRGDGVTLPLHLGVAGVVDRTKLMTMGMRLGVGASLRYLRKNRSGLTRLFASAGYNPSALVQPLATDFAPLGIERLHVFTFNQVAPTRDWQVLSLA